MSEAAIKWFVYIIQAEDGRLYTGITNNLVRRLAEHKNNKKKGAKFFRFSSACCLVWKEEQDSKSSALKREYFIKKLSRQDKLNLIRSFCVDNIKNK